MKWLVICGLLAGFVSYGFSFGHYKWKGKMSSSHLGNISALAGDRDRPGVIYLGSEKGVFKSSDGGAAFKWLFSVNGEGAVINQIYVDPTQPRNIYLATEAGLYESNGLTGSFKRIYASSDRLANVCLTVVLQGGSLYLGTAEGLFVRKNGEKSFKRLNNWPKRQPAAELNIIKNQIIAASDRKVTLIDAENGQISEILKVGTDSNSSDYGEGRWRTEDGGVGIDQESIRIKDILVFGQGMNKLIVASRDGLYYSDDLGKHWKLIHYFGLPIEDLTSAVLIQESLDCTEAPLHCFEILAGTTKGAFLYKKGKWKSVYAGMETNLINDLAVDTSGNVFAATGKGLFTLGVNSPTLGVNSLKEGVDPKEPSIRQVHEWAIDYAEVNNDKIRSWRKMARAKALVPSISVGIDRDAGDLYHWDTGAKPDELIRGKEITDWDVSVSWDLADMIWSTDQTTIDSRSKLMVELREDILDEVTRLYFERRRLQIEMHQYEDQANYETVLRVEELTALIDAMTGGEFSENIENNSGQ